MVDPVEPDPQQPATVQPPLPHLPPNFYASQTIGSSSPPPWETMTTEQRTTVLGFINDADKRQHTQNQTKIYLGAFIVALLVIVVFCLLMYGRDATIPVAKELITHGVAVALGGFAGWGIAKRN